MAFLASALPFLGAAGMGIAGGVGSKVGSEFGDIAGKGIRKLRKKIGFKKGGSFAPKAMSKALSNATVKKTGVRVVKKNQLVIPKSLATKIKAVAKRKPTVMKKRKKKN